MSQWAHSQLLGLHKERFLRAKIYGKKIFEREITV
jgi:hypothetical protein